ncbi:MAG: proton-conducting transporter membrane subunit, partial [Cyanobacteria bacterium P01_A01_bin.17]
MGLVFIAVGTGHTDTALLLMFTYAVSMALLVMSTGTIIWSNITQDVTQMGGVWARRPISGLAFLVGAAGLVGLPPLGGFWALLRLLTDLWTDHPLLVGVVLLVNALTTLSLARLFGLVFMGQPHAMMARSPEVLWPMVVPMTVLSGVVLHVPMILNQASALPDWAMLEKPFVLLLLWSCLLGGGIGGVLYIGKLTPRPIRLFWPQLQKAFANDLYTAEIYRGTIILAVNQVSRLVNWFDRIFVDGAVNGVGLATLFGGQTLKYNNTGAGQFYLLSIVIGVTLLIMALAYPLLS